MCTFMCIQISGVVCPVMCIVNVMYCARYLVPHIHICCVFSCCSICIEYCRWDTHWSTILHMCIVYEKLMILYSTPTTFALRWCVVNYTIHHTTQCYAIVCNIVIQLRITLYGTVCCTYWQHSHAWVERSSSSWAV